MEYENHPKDCTCRHCSERRACAKIQNPFAIESIKDKKSEFDHTGTESERQHILRESAESCCGGHGHEYNDCKHGREHAEGEEIADPCGCGHRHENNRAQNHNDEHANSCCNGHEKEHGNDCGHKHEHGNGCGHEDDCGCGHEHGEETNRKEKMIFIIRVVSSAILLALGWILNLRGEWNLALLIPAYIIIGYDVIFGAVKGIVKGKMFDERLLMLIASVGAFLISEAPEGVLVILLYQIGEFLTDLSLARSKKSISALTKLRPEFAVVLRNGEELKVAPDEVEVGERIVVRPGERIPLDGIVRKGKTSLDLSALTGESVPVGKKEGEEALSGAVNLEGFIKIEVTKPFGASAVMRILEMVGEASEKKTKTERFIKKFAKYYTPAVVVAAVLVAVIPPLAGLGEWSRWIRTALTFLVISCPCALVIAVPLTYFAGVGGASKAGILVKGGAALDALKKVKTVVFDKTGTLTEGVFEVSEVRPYGDVSETRLKAAASAAESLSNHPIAKSVIAAFGEPKIVVSELKELSGRGISVKTQHSEILAGNAKLMHENGIACEEKESGGSIVHVAENGEYLGSVIVSDRLKSGSKDAVASLKRLGIRSVMLTGDRESSAKEVAETLALDGYRAGLLPEDKVGALEELLANDSCAFVGDGVNDAPVISRADVGFAMGGMGQDAAIEAADVVIMDDNPKKVALAVKIAKKTGIVAVQNIVFALAVKTAFMVLGICGVVDMWLAVFADVGVTLLAVLNAMRAYYFRREK